MYLVSSLERPWEVKHSISSFDAILLLKRKSIVDRSLLKDDKTLLVLETVVKLVWQDVQYQAYRAEIS